MYMWRKDMGDFIIGCFMVHDMANPFLHTTLILKLVSVGHMQVACGTSYIYSKQMHLQEVYSLLVHCSA